jgi:hypothetical protein
MACCAIAAFCIFLFGRKIIIQRATTKEIVEEDVEMISTL